MQQMNTLTANNLTTTVVTHRKPGLKRLDLHMAPI